MKIVFADTYYFLALLNSKDKAHEKAVAFSQASDNALLTTAWVITELADGLSRSAHRPFFLQLLHRLRTDSKTTIVGPNQELFDVGLTLFEERPDKDWSLTDCISFSVMEQHDVQEALTADHHFEQAGFIALLK